MANPVMIRAVPLHGCICSVRSDSRVILPEPLGLPCPWNFIP